MEASEQQRRVREEVARRLDLITATPGAVLKYDRNGDGRLDDSEWAMLRAIVEAEVVRDLSDAPDTEETTAADFPDEDTDEWSIDEETADPHVDLPVMEVIDKRYELLREIGRGTQGRTYLGRARQNGDYVAVKEISFTALDSWKSLELFEREVAVLQELDHPAIPRFIDSFHVEVEGELSRFFLVQEFVGGDGLDVVLARGRRFTEEEIDEFVGQMLDVLGYLHDLNPPVIHRDIKPSNIIASEDGRYSLVDFGGVQLVLPDDVGGSTVVGTTGYMPPEQLTGRAGPHSDLYGLGATVIHLVTHVHPGELPQTRLRLDWKDRANVSDELAAFIDALTEPVVEDRPESAPAAARLLQRAPQPGSAMMLPNNTSLPDGQSTALVERRMDAMLIGNPQPPPGVTAKVWLEGAVLHVDLRTGIGRIGFSLVLAVFLWCILAGIWIAPEAALFGLLVLLGGAAAWRSFSVDEQFTVKPDGRFDFRRKSDNSTHTTTGRLVGVDVEGKRLVLRTDGSSVECGHHLGDKTRVWVAEELSRYLSGELRA